MTGQLEAKAAAQWVLDRPNTATQWSIVKQGSSGSVLCSRQSPAVYHQPALEVTTLLALHLCRECVTPEAYTCSCASLVRNRCQLFLAAGPALASKRCAVLVTVYCIQRHLQCLHTCINMLSVVCRCQSVTLSAVGTALQQQLSWATSGTMTSLPQWPWQMQ